MRALTAEQWQSRADGIQLDTRPIVGGAGFDPISQERFLSVNPHDNSPALEYRVCGDKDIDRVVSAARKAFDDGRWSGQSPMVRKAVLLNFAELLEQHSEQLALLDCLEWASRSPMH